MEHRAELASEVKSLFYRGDVEFIECMHGFCFDFVARKKNLVMLLKLLFNIDSLTPEFASDMKIVSGSLCTPPLIIGKKTRSGEMEDGVVYERYGINTVTPDTLEEVLVHDLLPSVISARGGYCVEIDGEKLREARMKKSISLGELAKMLGITRRMAHKYERENANPSLSTAVKLNQLLNDEFMVHVNLFSKPKIEENAEAGFGSVYKTAVFSKLSSIGIEVHPAKRAPFDAVTLIPDEKKAMLGRAEEKAAALDMEEVKFLREMLELILMDSFFVFSSYDKNKNMKGMPVLIKKEIDKIRSAEELLELIERRKGYG